MVPKKSVSCLTPELEVVGLERFELGLLCRRSGGELGDVLSRQGEQRGLLGRKELNKPAKLLVHLVLVARSGSVGSNQGNAVVGGVGVGGVGVGVGVGVGGGGGVGIGGGGVIRSAGQQLQPNVGEVDPGIIVVAKAQAVELEVDLAPVPCLTT